MNVAKATSELHADETAYQSKRTFLFANYEEEENNLQVDRSFQHCQESI